jgi:two-component system response regulator PilR (NtrC family)
MDDLVELLGESPTIQVVRDKLRRLLDRQRAGQRLPPILLQGPAQARGWSLVCSITTAPATARASSTLTARPFRRRYSKPSCSASSGGAFTDARRPKVGLFQAAHGGVLFLDEVALLPESAQAKLLTAIEERAVRRLGSTRPEPADVWLISATNAYLRAAVGARRFRDDLYHRLAVLTLDLPRLRRLRLH